MWCCVVDPVGNGGLSAYGPWFHARLFKAHREPHLRLRWYGLGLRTTPAPLHQFGQPASDRLCRTLQRFRTIWTKFLLAPTSPRPPRANRPWGVQSNFIDPPSLATKTIVVTTVMIVLASMFVLIRLGSIVFSGRKMAWDDCEVYY